MLVRKWRLLERKSFWIAIASVFLLCFSFWPYRVGCDCVIEPVKKRYVVAPFDGVFEKSLVRPGDVVNKNQKLAQMDGRELRMELAGVVADYHRARKSRDVNQAAGKTAAAQIDALEMQCQDQKRQLLESRIKNLDIKSPEAGIVVSGDLERTEGAPVKAGQAMYEIAPLDRMIVEIEVRDEDVANVASRAKSRREARRLSRHGLEGNDRQDSPPLGNPRLEQRLHRRSPPRPGRRSPPPRHEGIRHHHHVLARPPVDPAAQGMVHRLEMGGDVKNRRTNFQIRPRHKRTDLEIRPTNRQG